MFITLEQCSSFPVIKLEKLRLKEHATALRPSFSFEEWIRFCHCNHEFLSNLFSCFHKFDDLSSFRRHFSIFFSAYLILFLEIFMLKCLQNSVKSEFTIKNFELLYSINNTSSSHFTFWIFQSYCFFLFIRLYYPFFYIYTSMTSARPLTCFINPTFTLTSFL